jgi:hypothetical protein
LVDAGKGLVYRMKEDRLERWKQRLGQRRGSECTTCGKPVHVGDWVFVKRGGHKDHMRHLSCAIRVCLLDPEELPQSLAGEYPLLTRQSGVTPLNQTRGGHD